MRLVATAATPVARDGQAPDDLVRLVQAAQRQDRAAFAELYALYARTVHGILLSRVPRADVDDLLQDVFLQAMQRLPELREPSAFSAWLATIARNRAVDYFRHSAPTLELPAEVPAHDPDRTEALAVMAIIRSLPEAYRETLTLRLVEGLTGPEIAARTGLTEGSTRVNLHRGMKMLRERLEKGIVVTGDYLWDRTGLPDPELQRLERVLGTLQYQPSSRTHGEISGLTVAPARNRVSIVVLAATAAAVLALVFVSWHQAGVPRPALSVTRSGGTATIASRPIGDSALLPVGQYLETDASAHANVEIGTSGRVEVQPTTRLGLLSARPGDYRLDLKRGTMQAFIWAPPGQFSVKTPSSTAVDLGCLYTMTVDDDGIGVVRVQMGWVGFEWRGRESFIPKDAMCVTRPRLGPGTPHYEDTSPSFRADLELIDVRGGTPADREAALNRVLRDARLKDVLTLWHLLSRVDAPLRDRVYDRLADFVAPPAGATRDAVREGQREALDQWWDKLELGSATWWRMWKQQWRDNASSR